MMEVAQFTEHIDLQLGHEVVAKIQSCQRCQGQEPLSLQLIQLVALEIENLWMEETLGKAGKKYQKNDDIP